MMPEHNLVENNQELRKELAAALLKILSYEAIILDMQSENANLIRKTAHDLSSPLQVISMTIESLEEKVPSEMLPSIERMKRSADAMISIIVGLRKLRIVSNNPKLSQAV